MSKSNTLIKLILAASAISLAACATTASTGTGDTVVAMSAASAPQGYKCWNGCMKLDLADCPQEPQPVSEVQCWDGSIVSEVSQCPVQQTTACWDGSLVTDASQCPAQPVTRSSESIASLCGQEYRSETIYYEFDKGRSAESQSKINRILDIGEFCNVENITVVGHTDTSGSAAYNQTLSEKRAADARDELVRDGVNPNIITSMGRGETENFIDRGDGVKEELNRRTEVLIKLAETGGMMVNN
jgi:outer membrane protein OmpA-like peptidoglycan-associated protein